MQCTPKNQIILFNFSNAVLSLLGISLIALSVYELNYSSAGTIQRTTIVIQIFVGSFVILTSFLGCFSTCRINSLGLLYSYAICMAILLLFQIFIIIAAHTTDYVQNATDNYDKLWLNSSVNVVKISYYEQQFHCCGKLGSKDYILLDQAIHISCFKNHERLAENLFKDGCLQVLQDNARHSALAGLGIKWVIFIFELLALIVSALLGRQIQNQKRRELF